MRPGRLGTACTWPIGGTGSDAGNDGSAGPGAAAPACHVIFSMGCQTVGVPPHRDVAAFGERAPGYERGWRGRLHHDIARRAADDRRLRFTVGAAERLACPDDAFDLVVSTTSFDHWADQQAGLRECARVLAPGGHLLLADLFSPLLRPTLLGGRRGKARTRRRASRLLAAAGFQGLVWHGLYASIIKAVTATT